MHSRIAFAAMVVACGCSRAPVDRAEWPVMGTVAAVQTRGAAAGAAAEAVRPVFAEIERLMNAHDAGSELGRLAPLADGDVLGRCSPVARPCYEAAFRMRDETGGAFDPRWRGAGTMDLGAIAKGYAVDLAAERLGRAAVDTLVDLGGNLKAVRGDWKVGIRTSAGGEPSESFVLREGEACATSAEYYRGSHIRDGRTKGAPASGVRCVTVVHPSSAMLADALSTTMFILGRERGGRFLSERYPEARAIWYTGRHNED